MSEQIEGANWPTNPPWPRVRTLERRVGELEQQVGELRDMLRDVLHCFEQREDDKR